MEQLALQDLRAGMLVNHAGVDYAVVYDALFYKGAVFNLLHSLVAPPLLYVGTRRDHLSVYRTR